MSIVGRITELARNFASQAANNLADDFLQHCHRGVIFFRNFGNSSVKISLSLSYFGFILINLLMLINKTPTWHSVLRKVFLVGITFIILYCYFYGFPWILCIFFITFLLTYLELASFFFAAFKYPNYNDGIK